jgi:hypothetical protein
MKPFYFLLGVILFFAACKKDNDDPVTYPEENFLEGYLKATGFNQFTEINATGIATYAVFFTPKEKGVINTVHIGLPKAQSNIRVSLWDVSSGSEIKTVSVTVFSDGTSTKAKVEDWKLEKNKKYAISMNTTSSYDRRRTITTKVPYPVVVGNISIDAIKFGNPFVPFMPFNIPASTSESVYFGDLSFDFQRTE